MVQDDLAKTLLAWAAYVPVFPQWDPRSKITPLTDDAKDGIVYEISNDHQLKIGDATFDLKRHDLLIRINKKWELVTVETRNKEKFEKHITDSVSVKPTSFDFSDGVYKSKIIQNLWVTWKAALASTISG